MRSLARVTRVRTPLQMPKLAPPTSASLSPNQSTRTLHHAPPQHMSAGFLESLSRDSAIRNLLLLLWPPQLLSNPV
ncbi:hypothetical protein BC834DRAFT_911402, partial [Gloeopeniophorella convolvens]